MSDNVSIADINGSSATVATEDIGGREYQQVKIYYGSSGAATEITPTSGLPVTGSFAFSPSSGSVTTISPSSGMVVTNSPSSGSVQQISSSSGASLTVSPSGGSVFTHSPSSGSVQAISASAGALTANISAGSLVTTSPSSGGSQTVNTSSGAPLTIITSSGAPITALASSGNPHTVVPSSGASFTVNTSSGTALSVSPTSGSNFSVSGSSGAVFTTIPSSGAVNTVSPSSGALTTIALLASAGGSALTVSAGAATANSLRVTIDSSQIGTLGQTTMASSAPVAIASDQGAIKVIGSSAVRTVTLTMSTAGAYSSGQVHADTQSLSSFYRTAGASAVINSLQINDEDDQKAALDIYLFSSSASLGTERSAGGPNISDADSRNIIGRIRATSTDYTDLGGVSIAFLGNLGIPVAASSGASDICVGTVIGTAATYSSSGVRLYFGTMLD